jgi:2-polyprenyl-3-methyl-5-hydroxy-6-metoxy-1,4-benzoquinol methylase
MQSSHLENAAPTDSIVAPSPVVSPQQGATRSIRKPCGHPADSLTTLFPGRDFITGHSFNVAHCDRCGFEVTTPQPTADQMRGYYPNGYYGAVQDRRFPQIVETLQNALYTLRVREVEAVANSGPGRVLDVGCGRGVLLQEFRRRGWEVQGTELSESAASYARQTLKIPVEIGDLETISFPPNYFDAITLWHVLEHVADPRALLAEIRRILKPDGVLLVAVPNFGSLEARVSKDKWFHLDVPRHVTHFSAATLERALNESGFDIRHTSGFAPEYDFFSFIQSALNLCGLRHNLLYDIVRGKHAKVLSGEPAPWWQIAASLLLGIVLGILSVPATLLAGFTGQGGTISALAVKPAKPSAYSEADWSILTPGLKQRLTQK